MSKNGTIWAPCLHCNNTKLHHARGLCKCCYNHAAARGYLHLYPSMAGFGGTDRNSESTGSPKSLGRAGARPWMQGGMTQ